MIQHRPTTEILDRDPQQDQESELSLLGGLLVDPSRIDSVSSEVSSADFFTKENGDLFEAFQTLHDAGKPVDDLAILKAFIKAAGLADTWNAGQIGRLITGGGTGSNAVYYAKQIRQTAIVRKAGDIGAELLSRSYDPAETPESLLNYLDAQRVALSIGQTDKARTVGEIGRDVLDDIDADDDAKRGITTGLYKIDYSMGCVMPGELITVAARTGCGKSSFAMQVAQHNAERGRPVLFISLEMSEKELTTRLMCSIGKVDSEKLRTGTISDAERKRMIEAAAKIDRLPLSILAPPGATVAEVCGMARLHAKTIGCDLLIVDYVQIIRATDPRRQRPEQIAEQTGRLKQLAREINAPLLLLAQINRASDQNPKAEPRLSNLADSSAIEKDSDIVLFLHRHDKGTSAIVAKHRHGPTGKTSLRFNGMETRFEDVFDDDDGPQPNPVLAAWNEATL